MSFVSVMETIGKGFAKGLKWAVEYAVPVEKLVGLLFPAAAPVANEVADATSLIQNAVLLVEQKYAAAGVQNGTGAQKLAEVMLLTEQVGDCAVGKGGDRGGQYLHFEPGLCGGGDSECAEWSGLCEHDSRGGLDEIQWVD